MTFSRIAHILLNVIALKRIFIKKQLLKFRLLKFMRSHRELIAYGICGGAVTIVNLGLFQVLLMVHLDYKIANLITIVFIRSLTYFTNKFIVFRTKNKGIKSNLAELVLYIIGRLAITVIEFFGLILLVEIFSLDPFISKIIMLVLVIILNYLFNKFIVFKKT